MSTEVELKPGPELDALVAEKVMGWKMQTSGVGDLFVDASGEWCLYDDRMNPIGPVGFRPSTKIADAWIVVEKLAHLNPTVHYEDTCCQWSVSLNSGLSGMVWNAVSDFGEGKSTAPHAICLAALKAVGYENLLE